MLSFETVAEVHTEFIERHAPIGLARRVGIALFLTAKVEIHRCHCQCFQLCYIHSIGVVRACGKSCQLAGKSGLFIADRDGALRAYPYINNFVLFRNRLTNFGPQFGIALICFPCLLSRLNFGGGLIIGIFLAGLFQVILEIAPLFSGRVIPRHESVAVRDRMSADCYAPLRVDNCSIIAQCGSKRRIFHSR